MRLDALIFGGGANGLWLLDRLSRRGHHVLLLEANSLGAGQTVASQGILHHDLMPAVRGAAVRGTKHFRDAPRIWSDALLGKSTPNLSKTRLRSDCCHLWQSDQQAAGFAIAQNRLDIASETVAVGDRPEALIGFTGHVARLKELILSPRSLIQDLATQYRDRILQIDAKNGLEFILDSPGEVRSVRLTSPADDTVLELSPRQVIFTAGSGNSDLRRMAGLSADVMPRKPMQMVLARGPIPVFHGHFFDGTRMRFTITSETDTNHDVVWQIGGPITEDGVKLDSHSLTERAKSELSNALPGLDLDEVEWSTCLTDRADGSTAQGTGPDTIQVLCAGNVTTGWPTRLVLAPVLAQEIASRASSPYLATEFDVSAFSNWPRPNVALYPWSEFGRRWWSLSKVRAVPKRRAA